MRRWVHPVLVLFLGLSTPGLSQNQDKPYVEKVEVRVRSVLVFITDAKGRALTKAPEPSDLRVLENGTAAEVLAVEPVRGDSHPVAAAAPVPSPAGVVPAAGAATAIPQYLYLDTTSLQVRSVPRIVKALSASLATILASGPLEIVVADPEPSVLVPSTSDAAAIRAALDRLASTAVGKQRVYDTRRDGILRLVNGDDDRRATTSGAYRGNIRASIREELALIRLALERLDDWAGTLPYDRATVVYLCNDGFDGDLTEAYRKILTDSPSFEDHQAAMQLQLDFGRDAATLTVKAGDVLAGRGATAIVLAFGGSDVDFAMSVANVGKLSGNAMRRPTNSLPVSFFVRPYEPLLAIADRTGGQVVSVDSKLPRALDDLAGAYLVSFRSHSPADGAPHPLEITSTSSALKVRAPRAVLAATTQAAAAGQAIRALASPSAAGSLPVTASIEDVEPAGKGRLKGRLAVSADLASIAEALEMLGPGRVRVTIAVEHSKGAPFTQSEEADLDHSGEGTQWSYESTIVWPPEASRIAVTVEELKTGARGSAVAELPKD